MPRVHQAPGKPLVPELSAVVTYVRAVHEGLRILRVQPESRIPFEPGQYATLGLPEAAPILAAQGAGPATADADHARPRHEPHVLRRAYSISARMLDDAGRLVRPTDERFLELYVTLVPETPSHPAGLTPRLFALQPGDRLLLGPHAHGHYTLWPVGPADDLAFCATGTGEAPHNCMLAELLARGHRGRIAVLTCVRRRADLGYLETHRALEARYANYRYVPLTTREPENVDPSCPGFVGRQYLQDYVASGRLERETGIGLVPGRTHFYLCGNPQMIGLPHHAADGSHSYPRPVGMVETLERLGFELDSPGRPGTIHAEQYWAASEGQHMAGSIPESQ